MYILLDSAIFGVIYFGVGLYSNSLLVSDINLVSACEAKKIAMKRPAQKRPALNDWRQVVMRHKQKWRKMASAKYLTPEWLGAKLTQRHNIATQPN